MKTETKDQTCWSIKIIFLYTQKNTTSITCLKIVLIFMNIINIEDWGTTSNYTKNRFLHRSLWILLPVVKGFEPNTMMMMNCLCGMVDQQNAFNHISSQDHCERSSPMQISDMLQGGFEPAQNLSSGLVEWSCAVVITTTPQCHRWLIMIVICRFLLKRFILNIMISNVIIKCHWHNMFYGRYIWE